MSHQLTGGSHFLKRNITNPETKYLRTEPPYRVRWEQIEPLIKRLNPCSRTSFSFIIILETKYEGRRKKNIRRRETPKKYPKTLFTTKETETETDRERPIERHTYTVVNKANHFFGWCLLLSFLFFFK